MAMKKQEIQVSLRPLEWKTLNIRIDGIVPLVQHKWDEKNRKIMRDKKTGATPKGNRVRTQCVPEDECEAATYRLSDGSYALDVVSVKCAMLGAAHRDYGLPKTVVSGSIFIIGDEGRLIPLDTPGHKMREDVVRVGNGQADLRYRPEFQKWGVNLLIEYDTETINPELIVNLLERAGRKVGIGEGRPEKQSGLDWGRFTVKTSKEVKAK